MSTPKLTRTPAATPMAAAISSGNGLGTNRRAPWLELIIAARLVDEEGVGRHVIDPDPVGLLTRSGEKCTTC